TVLEYVPRTVVVVANKWQRDWDIALKAHNIQLLTVTGFRSEIGVEAIEIEGILEVLSESVGFGIYSQVDRSIRFSKTVRLPPGQIQLNDPKGGLATWTVTPSTEATWVTKDIGVPDIEDGSYIQIIRTVDGRLSIRRP